MSVSGEETDQAPGDETVEQALAEQEEAARARLEELAEEARRAGDSSLDALVDAASDESMDPLASAESEAEEPPPPMPETLVLPIALQGFQAGPLRVVVFGASDDDDGPAYDGLFIEYVGGR